MDVEEKVAEVAAIVGVDELTARHILEAAGWDLEMAVQLHLDGGAAEVANETDEAFARRIAQHGFESTVAGSHALEDVMDEDLEEPTRRPDDVRRERLYDGHSHHYGRHIGGRIAPQQVMPFRNFRDEAEEHLGDVHHNLGLGDIYRAPTDLMDGSTLQELKNDAEENDKWLLVNVQSNDEFASHQLNADVWGKAMIKEIIKNNFYFAQRTVPHKEAQQVVSTYQVDTLPAVIIIDPHTGQKMMQWNGLIQPDRFMEDIMPFMEIPPSHPDAGSLMATSVKNATFQSTIPLNTGSAGVTGVTDDDQHMNSAIAASLRSNNPDAAGPSGPVIDNDEDAELSLAIEMSSRHASAQAGPSGGVSTDLTASHSLEDSTPPVACEPVLSSEELQAAAASRVPAEPEPDTPGICRVAVRSPYGSRYQRSFLMSDNVSVLYDFVLSQLSVGDAAKPFALSFAQPGSQPLVEREESLEDAGIAGALLVVKWLN